MKELISMSDFVLEMYQDDTRDYDEVLEVLFNYAKFLKQPLKLEMFVPCNEEGNVLEGDGTDGEGYVLDDEMFIEHENSKEKVLFENIGLAQRIYILKKYSTIEDLTRIENTLSKITLTPSAIKQIGL